jgi:CHAT domain-containing protein
MPFESVGSGTPSDPPTSYLGVGAPLTRTVPVQISVAITSASPLRQQSDLAAALPTLPGARDELDAAASLSGLQADVPLVGAQATEDNFRRAAVRPHRIVHFATHALDPSLNPLILEPLLVLTRPDVEPFDRANDGVLTSSEISRLHLQGAIVLLSACRTAAPRHGLGAGLFSGLVQAFFQAGAAQAMATYWRIDDDATARLVVAIASRLERGQPVWTAVREAQMEFRSNRLRGGPPFMYHPYYWGAFVAVSPNSNSLGR